MATNSLETDRFKIKLCVLVLFFRFLFLLFLLVIYFSFILFPSLYLFGHVDLIFFLTGETVFCVFCVL